MLTKRQKITISAILLSIALFFLPTFDPRLKIIVLAVIIITSYFFSVWSIYYSFKPFEFISLFVLPVFLTASFGLYLTRFETAPDTRLILGVVYIVAMYTILLAENIFSVSTERNIPLVRAARTVGYLATLFVAFSFFSLLYGLRLNPWLFSAISAVAGSFLFAQGLWQINLKETNLRRVVYYSLIAGLILGEIILALAFWPLDPPKIGLSGAATVYVVLGLLQHHVREDLTSRTIIEYSFVGIAVVLLLIVSSSWGV